MVPLSLHEASLASRNAMLSAKVSKALRKANRGLQLDETDRRILSRSAELLTLILQGSALIERTQCQGLVPSANGLAAFGRAMTALQTLNLAAKADVRFTDLFATYRESVSKLAAGKMLPAEETNTLRLFFSTLADLFQQDVRTTAVQPVPDAVRLGAA